MLAKRECPEDHDAVLAYAKSLHVTVADLLEPAVEELIGKARAFIAMATVSASDTVITEMSIGEFAMHLGREAMEPDSLGEQ